MIKEKHTISYFIFLTFTLGMFSCSDTAVQKELKQTKEDLNKALAKIEQLKTHIEPEGHLVHLVFFKLKIGVKQTVLFQEIKKLEAIEVLKDLELGPFLYTGDDRALEEYDVLMEMSFDHLADYQTYQKHPIHLELKKALQPLLAGPPATFDYLKQ